MVRSGERLFRYSKERELIVERTSKLCSLREIFNASSIARKLIGDLSLNETIDDEMGTLKYPVVSIIWDNLLLIPGGWLWKRDLAAAFTYGCVDPRNVKVIPPQITHPRGDPCAFRPTQCTRVWFRSGSVAAPAPPPVIGICNAYETNLCADPRDVWESPPVIH